MYLRRKIDAYLTAWKADPERKPLIVKGARQIGKTESIRRFSEKRYKSVVEINFALEPKYKTITEEGYDVESIVKHITLLDPSKEFLPGETLVFFDELQEFPEIATALKAFCQDRRYDVICSGSLTGIYYEEIESNAVGNKEDFEMHSMDFEEFLWARGFAESQIEDLYTHMASLTPFSELELSTYMDVFRDYMTIGGMPEVVKMYIDNGHFGGTLELLRQLLLDYEEDITKYANGLDQTKILNVYRKIPVFLGKDNKKFQISKVAHGARSREYAGVLDWLKNAGIVNICYCLEHPELPLKGNYDPDNYRMYYGDTGMLIASLDDEAQVDLRQNKNFGVYKGALFENIVAQMLVAQGYGLYFFRNRTATLEMDFFIRDAESLIPVEVKAKNGATKSLNALIDNADYPDIRYGIKLCDMNIGCNDKFITFPYALTFLLKRWIMERIQDSK